MTRIKVLHVVWSATIGGIEKLVLDLIGEQKLNKQLEIAVLIGKKEGGFLEQFQLSGVPFFIAGLRSGNDFSLKKYYSAKKIFLEYDILHFHSYNPLLAKAAVKSGKKIIYTEHGNFGFGKSTSLTKKIVYYLQKQFLNFNVHLITFNSEFTKNTAFNKHKIQHTKNKVIYNGVSFAMQTGTSESEQDILDRIKNKFVIGTIARLVTVKHIDRLLNALLIFKEQQDVVLLLIGDGPLMDSLQKLALKLGIAGKVIFAGYRKNAGRYISRMSICAFPSQNEAFGLVAIEAWKEGKPVIVFSDAGGLAEIVNRYQPQDVAANEKEFAEKLNFYYVHKDEINSQEKVDERKSAAANFNIKTMEEKFFIAYKEVSSHV